MTSRENQQYTVWSPLIDEHGARQSQQLSNCCQITEVATLHDQYDLQQSRKPAIWWPRLGHGIAWPTSLHVCNGLCDKLQDICPSFRRLGITVIIIIVTAFPFIFLLQPFLSVFSPQILSDVNFPYFKRKER